VEADVSGRGRAQKTIELLEAAIHILEEIQPATVRAVCYRLFVEKLLPSMEKTNTNRISRLLTQAREDGDLDWDWVVDETREAERINSWQDVAAFGETVKGSYRKNYWSMQSEWIEIWSEKGTVRGTLAPILNEYGITFRVMHGHGSATAVHAAAEETADSDKTLTVLYVGDWDPSGMHMSEIDLPDRLDRYGGNVDLVRVAIDVEDTDPAAGVPWFPAADKTNDPRHRWFVERSGHKCWELDALSPPVLRDRIENRILGCLDVGAWVRAMQIEAAERESMNKVLDALESISWQATK
jgi:hypothetical protein